MFTHLQSAVRHGLLLPQGPEVSFSPLQPITEEAIGGHAHALLLEALEIIRGAVTHDYHVTRELFCADALLSRLGTYVSSLPSSLPPSLLLPTLLPSLLPALPHLPLRFSFSPSLSIVFVWSSP